MAEVQEKAQEVAGQAQEKAEQAAGQVKGRVREQVDQRSAQAAEQVSSTASDVRSVAEELRKQGKDGPAKIADQAAERAERVGSYLQSSDADRILSDVEDFGRRQPWAMAAGGLALGFAASRLLKASSRNRYQSRSQLGSPSESGFKGSNGHESGAAIGTSGMTTPVAPSPTPGAALPPVAAPPPTGGPMAPPTGSPLAGQG